MVPVLVYVAATASATIAAMPLLLHGLKEHLSFPPSFAVSWTLDGSCGLHQPYVRTSRDLLLRVHGNDDVPP